MRITRNVSALLVLIAALTAGGALAQDDAKDQVPHALAATPGLTPSRAVGTTHNCTGYYPRDARRNLESGEVQVRYDVGADGAISHVTLVKSSGHADLDSAALACVATQWRSTPARQNGVAVASVGHQAIIRFALGTPFGRIAPLTFRLAVTMFLGGLMIIGFAVFLIWVSGGSRRR